MPEFTLTFKEDIEPNDANAYLIKQAKAKDIAYTVTDTPYDEQSRKAGLKFTLQGDPIMIDQVIAGLDGVVGAGNYELTRGGVAQHRQPPP